MTYFSMNTGNRKNDRRNSQREPSNKLQLLKLEKNINFPELLEGFSLKGRYYEEGVYMKQITKESLV